MSDNTESTESSQSKTPSSNIKKPEPKLKPTYRNDFKDDNDENKFLTFLKSGNRLIATDKEEKKVPNDQILQNAENIKILNLELKTDSRFPFGLLTSKFSNLQELILTDDSSDEEISGLIQIFSSTKIEKLTITLPTDLFSLPKISLSRSLDESFNNNSLKELKLTNMSFSSSFEGGLFKNKMPNLKSLELNICLINLDRISDFEKFTENLEHLNLQNNQSSDYSFSTKITSSQTFNQFNLPKNLKSLNLSKCNLTMDKLIKIKIPDSLENLNISYNDFYNIEEKHFDNLFPNQSNKSGVGFLRLKRLDITDSHINSMKFANKIFNIEGLIDLNMKQNYFWNDSELEAEYKSSTSLKILDISGITYSIYSQNNKLNVNRFSLDNFYMFLNKFKCISKLDWSLNNFSSSDNTRSLEAIANTLEEVKMTGNTLSWEDLKVFSECKNLKTLITSFSSI